MRVMMTSCELETEKIKEDFLNMLEKYGAEAKALFIPTEAMLIRSIPDAAVIIDD